MGDSMSNNLPPPSSDPVGSSIAPAGVAPSNLSTRIGAILIEICVVFAIGIVSLIVAWSVSSDESSGVSSAFAETGDPSVASLGQLIGPFADLGTQLFAAMDIAMNATIVIMLVVWALLSLRSTTPGLKMMGLRVVHVRTGAPASFGQMLVRQFVGILGLLFAFAWTLASINEGAGLFSIPLFVILGLILIGSTPNRQAPWDLIAKTTVVRAN